MKKLIALFLLATVALTARGASGDPQTLIQLVDYIGVDYAVAVRDGEVISEAEYREMREFASETDRLVGELPASPEKERLAALADQLARQIDDKVAPNEVATTAADIRNAVMAGYELTLAPRSVPSLERGETLFKQQCASCHGDTGRGDGPAAEGMEPAPTDFHDHERAMQRSLFGLYNTITLGVEGTAMPGFSHLPEADRWALAYYAGSLFSSDEAIERGRQLMANDDADVPRFSLETLSSRTPTELRDQFGEDSLAMLAYLRTHPDKAKRGRQDPLSVAIARLEESLAAARAGEKRRAESLAVSAYLDGFELAEAGLQSAAPDMVRRIETDMMNYRQAVRAGESPDALADRVAELTESIAETRDRMTETRLSGGVAFSSALVILAREGLEAILILGAIIAFMLRTGHREALRWIHAGWVGALLAGVATWAVSAYLIEISGSARELTEGITALLAAVILFYVGFWMHRNLNTRRWNRMLHEKVRKAMDKRSLWTLAFVSFVAVYREVFETVLFFQALWVQVAVDAQSMVVWGGVAAAALLAVAAWAIFRFGIRLPIRKFFGISSAIMFVLAIIFAGKGTAALQASGHLPVTSVTFPRIDLLGIYPNAQALGAQLLLILLGAALMAYNARTDRV